MAQRIKFPREKGCGIFALMVIDDSDLDKRQVREKLKGVFYKKDKNDRGLMLNYCPFCGSRIDWFRETGAAPEKEPEEAANDL
jgi:hypothetical protein